MERRQLVKIIFFSIIFMATILPIIFVYYYIDNNYIIRIYSKQSNYLEAMQTTQIINNLVNTDQGKSENTKMIKKENAKSNLTYMYNSSLFQFYMPHPYIGFKSQPNVKAIMDIANQQQIIVTNELGHRSPTLGVKNNDTIRIAMLGGSTAFNGKTNNDTIIAKLAKILEQQTNQSVEFINAAIVSANSEQELAVLVHDLMQMDIDLLISFDGFNDYMNMETATARLGWPSEHWNGIYYPFTPALTGRNVRPSDVLAASNSYVNTIKKIALISQAMNISYIAVLQPMKGYTKSVCDTIINFPANGFYCLSERQFKTLNEKGFYAGYYLSYADILNESFFIDIVHLTDEGNSIVAQTLYDTITKEQLLDFIEP